MLLLPEGSLALDVLVYGGTDPAGLFLACKPPDLLLGGLVERRAEDSVERVWGLAGGHGWGLVVGVGEWVQEHEVGVGGGRRRRRSLRLEGYVLCWVCGERNGGHGGQMLHINSSGSGKSQPTRAR